MFACLLVCSPELESTTYRYVDVCNCNVAEMIVTLHIY